MGWAYYNEFDPGADRGAAMATPTLPGCNPYGQAACDTSGKEPKPFSAIVNWPLIVRAQASGILACAQLQERDFLRNLRSISAHLGSTCKSAARCYPADGAPLFLPYKSLLAAVAFRGMSVLTWRCLPFGNRQSKATCSLDLGQSETFFRTSGNRALSPFRTDHFSSCGALCTVRNSIFCGCDFRSFPRRILRTLAALGGS